MKEQEAQAPPEPPIVIENEFTRFWARRIQIDKMIYNGGWYGVNPITVGWCSRGEMKYRYIHD